MKVKLILYLVMMIISVDIYATDGSECDGSSKLAEKNIIENIEGAWTQDTLASNKQVVLIKGKSIEFQVKNPDYPKSFRIKKVSFFRGEDGRYYAKVHGGSIKTKNMAVYSHVSKDPITGRLRFIEHGGRRLPDAKVSSHRLDLIVAVDDPSIIEIKGSWQQQEDSCTFFVRDE